MKLNDIINDYHVGMSFRGGIIGGTTMINNISYVLIVGKSIKQHTFDYTSLNTTDNDGYTNTNNNHVFKKIINEYHHSGYNDWYIPSIEEIHYQIKNIGHLVKRINIIYMEAILIPLLNNIMTNKNNIIFYLYGERCLDTISYTVLIDSTNQ